MVHDRGCNGCDTIATHGVDFDTTAKANISVGEDKSGFSIIVLLVDHTIEADCAIAEKFHPRLPDFPAQTLSTKFGGTDVKTQEGVVAAIAHDGDDAGRFAINFANQETFRIGGVKRVDIVEAGIPAFLARPFAGEFEVGAGHGADGEIHGVSGNMVMRFWAVDKRGSWRDFAVLIFYQPEFCMSRSITLNETLTDYIRKANRAEHAALARCRAETDAMGDVAVMQISPEQGSFLQICARLANAKIAVEVGVFTGYSALATMLAMVDMHGDAAKLYGCDISEDYTDRAKSYWEEAGVGNQIELRIGDGRDTLGGLINDIAGQADMMFIDADKTGYDNYFEAGLKLLRPGGIILFDNVLWSGHVADPAQVAADPDTAALNALASKVRDDDRVDMAFTSIGDGILMAIKR